MEKDKPMSLKELVSQGYVFPAWLPEDNNFLWNEMGLEERKKIVSSEKKDNLPTDLKYLDLSKLDELNGLFVFLTAKDYGAASPKMWNALFDDLGRKDLRSLYFVGDPSSADVIVPALASDSLYLGGGFGSGWKEKHGYLSRVEPRGLLSINNIVRDSDGGGLVGFNTDVPGLLLPLEEKLRDIGKPGLEGKTVVMFGAGGVGKEIARGFADKGVEKLVVINRTEEKARDIAENVNSLRAGIAEYAGEDKMDYYLTLPRVDVAINVSKKGAEPLERYSAFAVADVGSADGVAKNYEESLKIAGKIAENNPEMVVYDINLPYSGVPRTLEIAREAGLVNLVDGRGMVANQGVIAVENVEKLNRGLFGKKLDRDYVKRIFQSVLE